MMTALSSGEIIGLLGVVGGSIGFTVGLYQYYIAQKWKRSEFAASLLDEFANDERLSTCCKRLDYSTRTLPVPKQYSALTSDTTFLHNWDALIRGMKHESELARFDWQETLYRDLFDYFFSYLERVNHYINIRLIDTHDVASLIYWVEQVSSPRFVTEPVFIDFIKQYGYVGVIELMEKFHIKQSKAPTY